MSGDTLVMLAITSPLWGSMLFAIIWISCLGIAEVIRAWKGD